MRFEFERSDSYFLVFDWKKRCYAFEIGRSYFTGRFELYIYGRKLI